MSLYKITKDNLEAVPRTTFSAEQILERNDLQRLLRQDISPIGDDLMVIAEEYSEWENVNRRIDLLCLNQRGDLVVVEIKRTEDGGHMELQAIRYAAMVSSMTLDQAVHTFARSGKVEEEEARREILDFLQLDSADAELTGEVRLVLVSADFSTEVATSVLWLNRQGLDITCIRLRPYRSDEGVFVEATQIIPLPEAADYEVKLRTQEREQKKATGRWQGELERFWGQFIRRHKDKFPFLANRSAPKVQKFAFRKGDLYELRFYVLKDVAYVSCEIRLPEDDEKRVAAVATLSEQRESIDNAYGDELAWEENPDRSTLSISQKFDRGWDSPESEWPTVQDLLIEKVLRLESALQQPVEKLRHVP